MATTVVKTIGTGGDYSLPQSWEDACPPDLRSGSGTDQIWQGQCKNQLFTSASSLLTISGTLVDATHYVELTAEAGASFRDNASVRTNALRANSANGATLQFTGAWANLLNCDQSFTRVSKLQFKSTTNNSGPASFGVTSGNAFIVDDCIFEGMHAIGALQVFSGTIRNSLVVGRRGSAHTQIAMVGGTSIYNSAFVATAATATVGLQALYSTATWRNVYVGNATATRGGSTTVTLDNCHSSTATSGWTTTPFNTTTFESITDGTHDFRLKAGSALIDAGTTDTTNAATDISGLARSGAFDVGPWEFAAASTNGSATTTPASVTLTPPSGSATGTGGTDGNASGALSSITLSAVSGSASGTTGGVGTITTPVLKNNAGTILASETGVTVNVYNATTGALIVQKTGQTSDGAGIVVITDAALTPATTYAYEVVLTGARRRLPTASAA